MLVSSAFIGCAGRALIEGQVQNVPRGGRGKRSCATVIAFSGLAVERSLAEGPGM